MMGQGPRALGVRRLQGFDGRSLGRRRSSRGDTQKPPQLGDGLGDFSPLGFDEVQQLLRGAEVLVPPGVRVDGLEVVALAPRSPRASTVQLCSLSARVGSRRKNSSKWSSVSGVLLADLHVGEVVVPDALGRLALGEEEQVGLHARAGVTNTPAGRLTMHQRSQSSSSLRLVWTKARLVRPEEHALVQHDAAAAAGA